MSCLGDARALVLWFFSKQSGIVRRRHHSRKSLAVRNALQDARALLDWEGEGGRKCEGPSL